MGLTMCFTLASSVWPGVGLAGDCSENIAGNDLLILIAPGAYLLLAAG